MHLDMYMYYRVGVYDMISKEVIGTLNDNVYKAKSLGKCHQYQIINIMIPDSTS